MIRADIHLHTSFSSDCDEEMDNVIKAGIDRGLDIICFTEHMDKEYHRKWFHLKGMLFPGIVFALIPSAIVGLIVMLIG